MITARLVPTARRIRREQGMIKKVKEGYNSDNSGFCDLDEQQIDTQESYYSAPRGDHHQPLPTT
jgi:hypothetical protein